VFLSSRHSKSTGSEDGNQWHDEIASIWLWLDVCPPLQKYLPISFGDFIRFAVSELALVSPEACFQRENAVLRPCR